MCKSKPRTETEEQNNNPNSSNGTTARRERAGKKQRRTLNKGLSDIALQCTKEAPERNRRNKENPSIEEKRHGTHRRSLDRRTISTYVHVRPVPGQEIRRLSFVRGQRWLVPLPSPQDPSDGTANNIQEPRRSVVPIVCHLRSWICRMNGMVIGLSISIMELPGCRISRI
ncbi:hypothetical protein AVEN_96432-1 [Araneus ventricosus]|uniref:Uncharacterized protein n=1 Tax=Araneus ventricosus TaxID=182803 RepID=A0A4Y2HX75_ARAVE|nr:hypothetical protein AVEN_96432-1 [Araneus ventricosus]